MFLAATLVGWIEFLVICLWKLGTHALQQWLGMHWPSDGSEVKVTRLRKPSRLHGC